MKQHRFLNMALAALGALALLAPLAASRQDPQQEILLQKAIQKETVDGDLNTAIKMYRQILENPGENRTVAAKALLQIGKCYEKLGNQEARKAYETLLAQYSDQREIATEARTRLAGLTKPADDSGIRMRQVWKGREANDTGSPSPDGLFLPYIDWDSGGNVAIREIGTGKSRLITKSANAPDHFALNPIMSPDGKQVAYQWQNEEFTYDLHVVGIDGSNPRVVYADSNYEVYPAAWSPGGRQIAVRRYILKKAAKDGPITTEIALIDVADGSIRVLKSFDKVFTSRISFSDDGRYLLYDFPSEKDSGKYDISMFAIDANGEVPLVRHPANDRLLGWIPGTQDLIFRSNRSGTDDLFILRVPDGRPQGAPEVIKRAIGEIASVGFVNDGSFYFSIYTRSASLCVTPFDMRSGKIQPEGTEAYLGSNMMPLWSPDGSYLAFATERNQPAGPGWLVRQLRIRNMKTGDVRETAEHLVVNKLCCWSPDARAIIVRGQDTADQGKYGIHEVALSSGRAKLLFELADQEEADALWTANRKLAVYSRSGSIIIRDLETKREIELCKQSERNIYLSISPDGEMLAIGIPGSQNSLSKILMIPISGGTARELTTLGDQRSILGDPIWTPDGKSLFFRVAEGKRSKSFSMNRISAEGGDPEKLESKDLTAHMSIHPNGRQVALSELTQVTEVWVMENLRRLAQ